MVDRVFIVGKMTKMGVPMHIFAVFREREAAAACCENANEWYGEDHPLTPLTVWINTALFEPKPFPVQALRRMLE